MTDKDIEAWNIARLWNNPILRPSSVKQIVRFKMEDGAHYGYYLDIINQWFDKDTGKLYNDEDVISWDYIVPVE